MQRENEWRQGVTFQTPAETGTREVHIPTKRGDLVTRRLLDASGKPMGSPAWPQQSADLNTRWCSSTVKIDVARSAIANEPRFKNAKVLLITGERRQESTGRSYYAFAEAHPGTSQRRRVDQVRLILDWTVSEVWGILQRWGIVAHPCYWLGFGRASCETCIFSQRPEWATLNDIHPSRVARMIGLEGWAGTTIDRTRSIEERLRGGYRETRGRGAGKHEEVVGPAEGFTPVGLSRAYWVEQALAETFTAPIRIPPGSWVAPPGASRTGAGPT